MEIWDSLNRRYLDFIKKRGARREESWLFRGLREPGRGRAEELARRALGPGSGFLPKKGKAGKKCEAAAGGEGEQQPRDGGQYGRLAAQGVGAATGVAVARARSREPRRARYAAGPPAYSWPGATVFKLLQLAIHPVSPSGFDPAGLRTQRRNREPGSARWGRPWRGGGEPLRPERPEPPARPAGLRGVGSLFGSRQAAGERGTPRRFRL